MALFYALAARRSRCVTAANATPDRSDSSQNRGHPMSMLNELASRHCTPLRGPEHLLAGEVVQGYLNALPGWRLVESGMAVNKTFKFENYYQTMAFVNALAFVAHREDHHPDLGVHYNRCVVTYSTHDVGGLSLNDFICAAKAELL
jgi:4a-hydroxytetrahydrobiopterin dehydratase